MDKPQIIVIDRNPAHCKLIEDALSSRYHLCFFESTTLNLAYEKIASARLFIVNFIQLKAEGYRLLQDLKASPLKRIPLIFFLDKPDQQNLDKAIELGANELIVMPATVSEISQRIDLQIQLVGLKSMLSVQQRVSQENWATMDRYLMFLFMNPSGIVTFISHALVMALGGCNNDYLGNPYHKIAQRHHGNLEFEAFFSSASFKEVARLKHNEALEHDWTIEDIHNGEVNWYQLSLIARFDDLNVWSGFGVFYRNINDKVKLKSLSEKDALTGIYNRLKLNVTLQDEIDRANRSREVFSVIMFDIDFFKEVNDVHGHLTGDSVLQELTQLIHKQLRRVDAFGRWGGEEFLVICPNTNEVGALNLAQKYKKLIAHYEFREAGKLHCSFGVAEYPLDTDRNTVLSHADKALYRAKDAGRNRVEYYSKYEYDL